MKHPNFALQHNSKRVDADFRWYTSILLNLEPEGSSIIMDEYRHIQTQVNRLFVLNMQERIKKQQNPESRSHQRISSSSTTRDVKIENRKHLCKSTPQQK